MSEEEDASQELLEQLKKIDGECEKDSSKDRSSKENPWKSLKLKGALGHVGLLVSLSIYCAVGGIVSLNRKIENDLCYQSYRTLILSLQCKTEDWKC